MLPKAFKENCKGAFNGRTYAFEKPHKATGQKRNYQPMRNSGEPGVLPVNTEIAAKL
jgi:hypothetical protein